MVTPPAGSCRVRRGGARFIQQTYQQGGSPGGARGPGGATWGGASSECMNGVNGMNGKLMAWEHR